MRRWVAQQGKEGRAAGGRGGGAEAREAQVRRASCGGVRRGALPADRRIQMRNADPALDVLGTLGSVAGRVEHGRTAGDSGFRERILFRMRVGSQRARGCEWNPRMENGNSVEADG